jgi:hypothetical protein
MRGERIAHETRGLRIPRVGKSLAELFGKKLGDLVFEPRALVVGEWQVVRVGADPKHFRIDKLDCAARVFARLSVRH